jgi:cell division protein FtsA
MARPRITTGIDIGSDQIKVVVIEEASGERGALPRIIATGLAKAEGMRHGYVTDRALVAGSIRDAKRQAESMIRMPLKKAFLAIGGISLDETRASGEAIISRADQEITELDLEKTLSGARELARPHFTNKRILHEIPLEFRIDGVKVFGNPLGLVGTHLEADYLFITALAQHVDTLISAAEDADIEVIDQMASPLAGSYGDI